MATGIKKVPSSDRRGSVPCTPPLASSESAYNLSIHQRTPDLPTARDLKDWQRHTFTDGMGDAKEDEVQDRYTDRITDKHMGTEHCLSSSISVSHSASLPAPMYVPQPLSLSLSLCLRVALCLALCLAVTAVGVPRCPL